MAAKKQRFISPKVAEYPPGHWSNCIRVGDQIQVEGSEELMLVTAVNGDALTVVRGYAGTTAEEHAATLVLRDAQAKGILVSAKPARAPDRESVIVPAGDDALSRFARECAIGVC